MKISKPHRALLIELLLASTNRYKQTHPDDKRTVSELEHYYIKNKIGHDSCRRFRWDLFWIIPRLARITWLDMIAGCDRLGIYPPFKIITDDHIDAALRSAVAHLKAHNPLV